MSSFPNTAPPTKSPMDKVPYDVLLEIFIHYLPWRQFFRSPHRPYNKIAPMLLCQVCVSWRMAALASSTLWTHLSYTLTVIPTEIDGTPTWAVLKKEIEFLQWWKQNHASLAPFLSLGISDERRGALTAEHLLPGESLDFLLTYITSAQYLEIDHFYFKQILKQAENGNRFVFPNLHHDTLVGYYDHQGDDGTPTSFHHPCLMLLGYPHRSAQPSKLRNLHIREHIFPEANPISNHWSSLTHTVLCNISISVRSWFILIHSLPNLQRAYFWIDEMFDIVDYTKAARFTLSELVELAIKFSHRDTLIELPLSIIFTGLHLPALQTLSLFSYADCWKDIRAVDEISNVLESTPNVTTLFLGPRFLSFNTPQYDSTALSWGDIISVWSYATNLAHLQFGVYLGAHLSLKTWREEAEEVMDTFVRKVFVSDNKWLNLTTPVCPIQKITIFLPRDIHSNMMDVMEEYSKVRTDELAQEIPNIDFEAILAFPVWKAENAREKWCACI